jgi:hypothetical protein
VEVGEVVAIVRRVLLLGSTAMQEMYLVQAAPRRRDNREGELSMYAYAYEIYPPYFHTYIDRPKDPGEDARPELAGRRGASIGRSFFPVPCCARSQQQPTLISPTVASITNKLQSNKNKSYVRYGHQGRH